MKAIADHRDGTMRFSPLSSLDRAK
jgi:hypothetical protein